MEMLLPATVQRSNTFAEHALVYEIAPQPQDRMAPFALPDLSARRLQPVKRPSASANTGLSGRPPITR
jgi:hypothetical protein